MGGVGIPARFLPITFHNLLFLLSVPIPRPEHRNQPRWSSSPPYPSLGLSRARLTQEEDRKFCLWIFRTCRPVVLPCLDREWNRNSSDINSWISLLFGDRRHASNLVSGSLERNRSRKHQLHLPSNVRNRNVWDIFV